MKEGKGKMSSLNIILYVSKGILLPLLCFVFLTELLDTFFPFLGPVLVILEVSSAQTLNNPLVLESLLFNLFWTLWIVLHSDYFISLVVNLVTTALAWESVFKSPCRQFTSPLGLWFSRFPKLGQSYELTVKNTSVRPFSRKIWLVILERMLITGLSRTITKFRES